MFVDIPVLHSLFRKNVLLCIGSDILSASQNIILLVASNTPCGKIRLCSGVYMPVIEAVQNSRTQKIAFCHSSEKSADFYTD